MLSTLKSKRPAVLSILLLVVGFLSALGFYRTSANNSTQNRGQGKRVPLTVLQSSEPPITSDYGKKSLLAPSKDGQSLYSLDAVTGELIVYEKNGKLAKKAADSFLNVEAFAVGPKHERYLAQLDSKLRIVSSDGHRLNVFRTVYPKSGEGPRSVDDARELRDAFVKKGWALNSDLKYFEAKGSSHNEESFARRVEPMLKHLFPAGADRGR